MRPFSVLAALSLLSATAPADDSPARLEAVIRTYVEKERARVSVEAPDLSAERFRAEIEEEKKMLRELEGIEPDSLSLEERVDWMLLRGRLQSSVFSAERRRAWENDPALYLPGSRLSRLTRVSDPDERAEKLARLLRAVPAMLEAGRSNSKNPPRRFTEEALFQTRGTIETLETESFPEAESALAALAGYERFLEGELMERSTGDWVIGAEEYDHILEHRWFLEEDAGAILAIGKRVFEETEALAQEVANRIEPGKHWVEVYERLKDDHPPADRLKEAYQEQMDAARAFLIQNEVVSLPQGERVVTLDTPPAMRRSSPYGTFSSADPFGDDLEGRLMLTPIEDWMSPEEKNERIRAHHRAWIPIIAVHEAYPGHHVHALKIRENPRILRKVVRESIFSEGWGLFTEEMMFELGFLQGDDVRLTQLRNRLWRAARVILDVSLHTGKMNLEQAVDFLVSEVRFDRYAAELEVGMYPRNPTYVLGYLIGMLKIDEIRRDYFRNFGRPQEPREFYDKLLVVGSIPPALVRLELLGEM